MKTKLKDLDMELDDDFFADLDLRKRSIVTMVTKAGKEITLDLPMTPTEFTYLFGCRGRKLMLILDKEEYLYIVKNQIAYYKVEEKEAS